MPCRHLLHEYHPLEDQRYQNKCRAGLDAEGALVLKTFFTQEVVKHVVEDLEDRKAEAYYTSSTHNVYLTPTNPNLRDNHPFNRQVISSKGLLADDQIPMDPPLRDIYND